MAVAWSPRKLAGAALLAAAAVCAPHAPAQPPANGTVLVRPSVEGLKYVNKYLLKARPAGGGEAIEFQSWGWGSDGYWSRYYEESEKGELVSLSLPAGDYEFFNFLATAGAWGGTRTVWSSKDFSYRFRVNPGEAVYVGNLHVRFLGDKGVVSPWYVVVDSERRMGLDISVRDARERDLADAAKREPELARDRVQVRLLR